MTSKRKRVTVSATRFPAADQSVTLTVCPLYRRRCRPTTIRRTNLENRAKSHLTTRWTSRPFRRSSRTIRSCRSCRRSNPRSRFRSYRQSFRPCYSDCSDCLSIRRTSHSCRPLSTSFRFLRRPDYRDRCGLNPGCAGCRLIHRSSSRCSTPSNRCHSSCSSHLSSSCLDRVTSSNPVSCDPTGRSSGSGHSVDQPSVCLLKNDL